LRLTNGIGTKNPTTRTRRYRLGRISQAAISEGLPLVRDQKRRRERASGIDRAVATR
jgi:hypothetical protein